MINIKNDNKRKVQKKGYWIDPLIALWKKQKLLAFTNYKCIITTQYFISL